jgi:hypothetical protein
MSGQAVTAELLAVVVAMVDGRPNVLTIGEIPSLPAGPLLPSHRSLQSATRAWVEEHTGRQLGYLEQLYTFADLDRAVGDGRRMSVSYLGLTTPGVTGLGEWTPWYRLFPWEDTRTSTSTVTQLIAPALKQWAGADHERQQRAAISFGLDGQPWKPDAALQRYELLYEAGLVAEAGRADALLGDCRMVGDHRRVLATGMARLRAKIEYRPVVFELLSASFTLRQLQDCVEALAGREVHTQNFRRLIAAEELVEETGDRLVDTGGRPARLYRFRREILANRRVAGTRLPAGRSALSDSRR